MNKRIRIAIAAATIVGGFTMTSAGSASAAHCAKDGSPGFSYFGKDGRTEPVVFDEEGNAIGGNAGGPGGNECPANTGSPSVRAPGQNKG